MAVTIRNGKERDFPIIIQLIKDLAAYENAPKSVRNSISQMRKEKKLFDFFVAEDGGKVVGFALYFFAYYTWVGKSLYLDDIYVRPEYRGKKVGSILLRKVFEVAKRENCKRIRWQVLDWNKSAIKFYIKHSANISSEWLNCDFDADGIRSFLRRKS